MNNIELKNKIIKMHFEVNESDYNFCEEENILNILNKDYLLLTNAEATNIARENIKNSLWCFKSGFLEEMTGIDAEVFEILQEKYEDSNNAILKLIESNCGIDDFIETAINYDGRGHFIASYDGEEECLSYEDIDLFLYRI